MDDHGLSLTIDVPGPGIIRLTLVRGGRTVDTVQLLYQGHVDNLLLTGVDNVLKRSRMHKSALRDVKLGAGIDKNSSLYRIVQSFASAIRACLPVGRAARGRQK